MKLNFWQILGLILIIAAVVLIVRREIGPSHTTVPSATSGS